MSIQSIKQNLQSPIQNITTNPMTVKDLKDKTAEDTVDAEGKTIQNTMDIEVKYNEKPLPKRNNRKK